MSKLYKLNNVEYHGKSNSSSGNWVVKLKDQTFKYFWYKKDMTDYLESLMVEV